MSQATKRKHVVKEVLGEHMVPSDQQQIVRVSSIGHSCSAPTHPLLLAPWAGGEDSQPSGPLSWLMRPDGSWSPGPGTQDPREQSARSGDRPGAALPGKHALQISQEHLDQER